MKKEIVDEKLIKLEIETLPKELCGNGFAQIISNELDNNLNFDNLKI